MPDSLDKTNCDRCDGHCCKYVTAQIATPRRPVDFDEIRWFLEHEKLEVFIDDGAWFIRFQTPCRHLASDGRCRVYEKRFLICRRHDPATCERSGRPMPDTFFRSRAEFERWRKGQDSRRRRLVRRGKRMS